MRHSEFTEMMRDIARRHVDLKHSANEMHFARIVLNQDPFLPSQTQITEFLNAIRSQMRMPFMLSVAYVANFSDPRDHLRKHLNSAIIILDKVTGDDPEEQEEVYDRTEQLCEEIMGFLKQYFDSNEEDGFFETNEMEGEKVANVCNEFFGTKYNFQIHFGYEDGIRFKPAKFNLGELDPENLTPLPESPEI